MQNEKVRKVWLTFILLAGLAAGVLQAETFNLTTGERLEGELLASSANDAGVQVKVGEGEYKRVPWANFSQEDLKRIAQNAKLQAFVEPFVEVSQDERLKKTEINVTEPERLKLPEKQSIFGALFSSGLGIFLMLVLWGANVYAGYEVAIYRARPKGLVCGVSAVLPIIGPAIFAFMPTVIKAPSAEEAAAAEAQQAAAAAAAAAPDTTNPMLDETAAHPSSGLHIAHEAPAEKTLPQTVTFPRGQYTFNRRFFETRFASFFTTTRREADKDMVLVFKTTKGEFTTERISRIAAADLHVNVHRGAAVEEITIPFTDIQEVQHKHKSA